MLENQIIKMALGESKPLLKFIEIYSSQIMKLLLKLRFSSLRHR
jgi:hypothetical protein